MTVSESADQLIHAWEWPVGHREWLERTDSNPPVDYLSIECTMRWYTGKSGEP